MGETALGVLTFVAIMAIIKMNRTCLIALRRGKRTAENSLKSLTIKYAGKISRPRYLISWTNTIISSLGTMLMLRDLVRTSGVSLFPITSIMSWKK